MPIAAVTTFRHRDVLYCRDFGIAGGEARQAHAYFNTCYYGAVEHAYSLGLGWVSLGTSTFWAKVRRGATLAQLTVAVPPTATAVGKLLAATDRHLRETLPWAKPDLA